MLRGSQVLQSTDILGQQDWYWARQTRGLQCFKPIVYPNLFSVVIAWYHSITGKANGDETRFPVAYNSSTLFRGICRNILLVVYAWILRSLFLSIQAPVFNKGSTLKTLSSDNHLLKAPPPVTYFDYVSSLVDGPNRDPVPMWVSQEPNGSQSTEGAEKQPQHFPAEAQGTMRQRWTGPTDPSKLSHRICEHDKMAI